MHCQDSHTTVTSVMVPYGTVCHAAVRGTHIALHRCHKDSQPWVVACARSPCPREGQEERHELMAVCVLASFPVTVVTSSNRSTEGRKGLFWLAVQGTVHHGGGGSQGQQELEAAHHITPSSRKQAVMKAGCFSTPTVQDPSRGMVPPRAGTVFHLS